MKLAINQLGDLQATKASQNPSQNASQNTLNFAPATVSHHQMLQSNQISPQTGSCQVHFPINKNNSNSAFNSQSTSKSSDEHDSGQETVGNGRIGRETSALNNAMKTLSIGRFPHFNP